jgi:hypothetical protein
MGDTFRPRGIQQQTPFQSTQTPVSPPGQLPLPSASSQPPDAGVSSPYPGPPDQISQSQSQPMNNTTTNNWGTLSQETILKIAELKRLVYRHPIFSNPDVVIKCATYFSINGDNTILDEKLERLRSIDAISKY